MHASNLKQPIPPLWLGLWVSLLTLAWLLPNHYYPWATFHSDAWVAVMFAIAAVAVIVRSSTPVRWHGLTVLMALLAIVPFIQLGTGLLYFSGKAWVCAAYVWGFMLALLIGARWEAATPGRAADGLLLAVGVAALISVGMQLRQWLGVSFGFDEMQIWAGEYSPERPAANLGQPNQLATLLLWGLMGCAWAVVRNRIRPAYAIIVALFLIFGLVLTQSRIAMIAMFVITVAAWGWRRLFPSRLVPKIITLLFLYFIFCTLTLQHISDFIGLDLQIRPASLGGASTHLRLQAYSLFFDAILRQPWWGYGWNQLGAAQLAVAQDHPNLTSFFLQSHNLFLDLVIWCGLPIGCLVSISLMAWMYRQIRQVATLEAAILTLFVVVVGLHAMVELPLHHAYFLLPTGLVMGMLSQSQEAKVFFTTGRGVIFGFLLALAVLLGTIIRDYLHVDESFRVYRLEIAHVGKLPVGHPPDVVLLNDLYAFILNARTEVKAGMTDAELVKLEHITSSFPSTSNLYNYAKALALNGKKANAEAWMEKIQRVEPDAYSRDLQAIWASEALKQPAMGLVKWPPLPAKEKLVSGSVQP